MPNGTEDIKYPWVELTPFSYQLVESKSENSLICYMLSSILQKRILISLGFTLQMTLSWKKAVPHGWIPSSILTACCCGTGCRRHAALFSSCHCWTCAKVKSHTAFTQHRGSAGSSQPAKHERSVLEAMWLQAAWANKSNHNLSETVTHRGHLPNAVIFIARFQSFVRISTVIYQSDRNWLRNPPQARARFCFVLFPWIVCFIYAALHDVIYHILESPPN